MRGRPRTHPVETTASERVRAWRAARIAAGGRSLSLVLSPEAAAALAAIRERIEETSDAAVIERVLTEAATRFHQK